VSGPDGVTVQIPPGALDSNTLVTIAIASPGEYPAIPAPYTAVTPVYAFLPHGLQFHQPVTIDIPVPSGASNLVALHAEQGGAWGTAAATIGSSATITTSSFSFYTLATPTSAADAGDSAAPTCTATFTGAVNGTVDCSSPPGSFWIHGSPTSTSPWNFGFDDALGGGFMIGSNINLFNDLDLEMMVGPPSTGTFGTAIGTLNSRICARVGTIDTSGSDAGINEWLACWSANADSGTAIGTVSITIDSLGPFSANVDGCGNPGYASPHGTFSGTLVDQSGVTNTNVAMQGTF
jgi:hypothetical protein